MKERFGKLSLYLINQAENEIKKINQQTLFQMAEVRKKARERTSESSLKMKAHFNETYNKLLNNSLSSYLLKIKEEVLKSKNKLMLELISDLKDLIKDKIKNNYSSYIILLLKNLENIKHFVDKPPEIIIHLNSIDFKYFSNNMEKIESILRNKVNLIKSKEEFTGGFKCVIMTGHLSYDYTIKNQLKKSTSIIEIEFSKIFSDSEPDIKALENNYIQFIKNQKLAVNEYLKKYE
ncbi:V-type proton ATPase subunit E [subsurface metagenome]